MAAERASGLRAGGGLSGDGALPGARRRRRIGADAPTRAGGPEKRFDYRRLGVLLRREGVLVNHKRVYRPYREEGLSLRRRKRKRLTSEGRGPGEAASGPNEVWSLDFVSDATATSRRLKLLTVLDSFTWESLAIEVDISIGGERLARVLDRVIGERGAQPLEIIIDDGPEMTSWALDQ